MSLFTNRPARTVLLAAALATAAALLPGAAGGQSVLLVVVEAANSQPVSPPLPVREGLSGTLFDAGCIVMDSPGSTTLPAPAEAARMARSAGAELALEVATEYADTSLGKDLLRISAQTTYALIDPSTSSVLAGGTRVATNQDRERDVDRAALGVEIGRDLAQIIRDFLDRHPVRGE
jgi:hypothetical protein